MPFQSDQTLDDSGLACPMPILKTKKAIDGMQVGQVLKMIATDPGSVRDIDAWTDEDRPRAARPRAGRRQIHLLHQEGEVNTTTPEEANMI